METIYLVLVGVLFLLAISDLVVGVSNDAVNFLNSAIGAKVASFRTIMIIAALGVFIGASFSGGMMEVARKGIFNPQYFTFENIMIIFMAVMITDVILLDLFNTFGLPTSTTVSIVFELLGAAIGVALIKSMNNPEMMLSEYINSAKALAIISGILLSVVVSFTVGMVVQYIARILFSFNFKKRIKYFGGIWGGIAITAITYFLIIKGAKGAAFMSENVQTWIAENDKLIIVYSLIFWTVILQGFYWLFKVNILKFTVLAGTFALAMAFAGNDLVNFIGVPLAGFEAFKNFMADGGTNQDMLMTSLAGKVKTDSYLLVIAGLIMVVTLWTSKKAKKVVKTSLDLGRQSEGEERFGSSFFARSIVRGSIAVSNSVNKLIPARVNNFLNRQFDSSIYEEERQKVKKDEAASFDMIRASVNLVVASILIAFATSLKLPLSTTYVTFMVAMGSSLSDRAWGRESAVYRITGVVSVIGGWFFTAFSAATVAFIFANLMMFGGIYAIVALVGLAAFMVYRTHVISKKQETESKTYGELEIEEVDGEILSEKVLEKCRTSVSKVLREISGNYGDTLHYFEAEDRKHLKETTKEVSSLNKKIKKLKSNIYNTVRKLQEESIDSGLYYVQVIDYLRETTHTLTFITNPCFEHLDNNHKVFTETQLEEINIMESKVRSLLTKSINMIDQSDFTHLQDLIEEQGKLIELIKNFRKKQLKRIKKEKAGTKISMLYLSVLHETQNMLLHLINLLKAQRDFVASHKK
ncbi:inorganic phosphate transporter [Marinilabilia salmonicolor]|jgi:phosphate/sulfate permease/ferritin|uniref:Phosphate transporter n=1 Tax=Marinilabilia salmonicolor TaxID=989 RepID=A0A2T0XMA2_9BACT|nr:inorganic phosphate transporter [Marinilabilia salmonicolor]PRZ00063.1 phosphate transporter family protein [Marinilabilia salmonicolor]RCW38690.1 phosphate transporter family protein [Marinilabilia salmonicolor]